MIRAEYIRFLQTLNAADISCEVRKIANLVLQNLDKLILLSTSQGQRIKEIVRLAQEGWNFISSDIVPPLEQASELTCPIIRLTKLSVGPFRGFSKKEDFDLASPLVLIYGPNGTGKSSFCEALEYSMLGIVAEAESKRFRNEDYLNNAHTKKFIPPILIGEDSQGNEIPVSANETLFRFCFVEKTRIDSFSRIAAQTPSKQSELISTLFGLDAYAEFVHNFTATIDGKYIDLEGKKTKELKEKRQTLEVYQKQHETIIPEELKLIENEENLLANKYRESCTFTQMVTELRGSDDKLGLIKQLEDCLQKPIGSKSYLTIIGFHTLKNSIKANIEELNIKHGELSKASQQVIFKQLYEAVTQLKEKISEVCPACQTPLIQVKINPFEYATDELKKLEYLSQLQEAVKKLEGDISTSWNNLSKYINACCARFPENNPLSDLKSAYGKTTMVDWWNVFHQKSADELTAWQHFEDQVKKLENDDKVIEQVIQRREAEQTELKRLREFDKEVDKLQTRRDLAINIQKSATEEIEKFDTENAVLIADVEKEKACIVQNQIIVEAYASFVQKLNTYKDGLPAKLVTDLGGTVVQLYNAFNRDDLDSEQLSFVRLPLQQNQRLEISFKKAPDTFFDALHILSEGHIRCIGLAILTAKNIKENCPLLIFDDPVNAIDDDHRGSIRRTLFKDAFFNNKQIILTCHGEEFFKDIQNLLSKEEVKQSKLLSFLPKHGDSHIRVDHNCLPRNYISLARSYFEQCQTRDALTKSRQALEFLTYEVWHYINKCGGEALSITMRSPKSPIELRNLTEQLRKKIIKVDQFHDKNKMNVLGPIESLLGLDSNSREWKYLNKGTHEESDREEFERPTVDKIIIALEQLDAARGG